MPTVVRKFDGGTPELLADARPFVAEVDAAEVDERDRPGATFHARTESLSRAGLVLVTRKLSFVGRHVIVAVHHIDSGPTLLFGAVRSCVYLGEGQHRLVLDFEKLTSNDHVHAWANALAAKRRSA